MVGLDDHDRGRGTLQLRERRAAQRRAASQPAADDAQTQRAARAEAEEFELVAGPGGTPQLIAEKGVDRFSLAGPPAAPVKT